MVMARLRLITTTSPSAATTVLPAESLSTPSLAASKNDCSATCTAPPMWKVRIVSWVPGSPIDCAAMTPTASPMFTGVPRAKSRP